MLTISFFGHRRLLCEDIEQRLISTLEPYLMKHNEVRLLVGRHGEFDSLALSVCRELRKKYSNIKIIVILTSLTILKRDSELNWSEADAYKDVETMIYNIEEEHFKNQIVSSNKQMVDDSDMVICYVDMSEYRSGAKRAVKYAIKQGVEVINIFDEKDKPFLWYDKRRN